MLAAVGSALAAALVLGLAASGVTGSAHAAVTGSDGGGDPYFPLDGNGGYQVEHYRIRDDYRPGSDRLTGRHGARGPRHRRTCAPSTSTSP